MTHDQILLKLIELLVGVKPPANKSMREVIADLNAVTQNNGGERFIEAADWVYSIQRTH